MKSKIPIPVVILSVVLLVGVVGFFLIRTAGATSEFPAPATGKTIPQYVWDGMDPGMQAKMKAEGYTPGDVKPQGAGAPTTRPQ